MSNKDDKCVHTEHCCKEHGCKYGEGKYCPIENGTKKQSFPCEYCDYDSDMMEDQKFFVLLHTESHRDKFVTFLGVFTSKAKAEARKAAHQEENKSAYFPNGWPGHEYTIIEAEVNGYFNLVV